MVGQERPGRRSGGEESLEEKRHRMRVAQRKHRARKEQTIADLEENLNAARMKLDDVQRAFHDLHHAIAQSSYCTSLPGREDVEQAMEAMRAALALDQDPRPGHDRNSTTKSQLPNSYFDSMPFWGTETEPTTLPDECPGSFALQLYEHCTNFAVRILACAKGPLNALARRLFHEYLLQMTPPESGSRLDILRECMEQRAQQIARVNDAGGKITMGKVFRKPRIAGFSHYLNVSQVEEYLKTRGFDFNKGPDVVHIVIPGDASAKSTPDLETDDGDSDDTPDQQDQATGEPWWEYSQYFPHSRNASYDTLNGRNDSSLPLGMHDNGEHDAELLAGFGLPGSAKRTSSDAFGADFGSSMDSYEYCSARSAAYGSVPRQHVIEVSMSELLKRLVSIGICIGAPGPGWEPNDVSRVADDLMEGV